MLSISTLTESIDYLSKQTSRQWTESEFFDAATKSGIILHAATPTDTLTKIYEVDDLTRNLPPKHIINASLLAILYPFMVGELWIRGKTKTTHDSRIVADGEYAWFTEPITVLKDDLRIGSESLHKILNYWKEAQSGANKHRFPEWMIPASTVTATQPAPNEKPWNIVNPNDPSPAQPWYTPARYYARQLIQEDTTLLTKRNILAEKVSQSLSNAGIYGRIKNEALNSSTILKAFSKVTLG